MSQLSNSDAPDGGWTNAACPWLPVVESAHDFRLTRRHGTQRGLAFYRDALSYAQSQWRVGKPAQALLQLDKAWMADLDAGEWRVGAGLDPYRAMVWMMLESVRGEPGYLGNPVRHFQHLASRISGPRAEQRAWRAWACLHLAEHRLPRQGFPRDGVQIAREGLWVPGISCCLSALSAQGWAGEAEVVAELLGF